MMKHSKWRRRLGRSAALAVVWGLALSTLPAAAAEQTTKVAAPGGLSATIRYTEHGIPHIKADDYAGLGYGHGYAAAKDNICLLADIYLTVGAQRSLYRGADGPTNAYGPARSNLGSDLYFQQVNDSKVVEKALAEPAPLGPRAEVRDIVRGYVSGYNRYLAETGPDGITDPACRGAAWLRPIQDIDVYRQFHALSTSGGGGRMIDAIVDARPPAPGSAASSYGAAPRVEAAVRSVTAGLGGQSQGNGSNAFAIGAEHTENGRGLLLSNPHFAWSGAMRLWEAQLTVPGKMNVSGGGLLGVPLIRSGHTQNVAWSHTVSSAVPLGLYQLQPVPGDPTAYLVDGRPERMTQREVAVRVRDADGTVRTVGRTLWSTRYGPVLSAVFGLPTDWTTDTAYALRDANVGNLRGLNTWFDLNRAQSTKDVQEALVRTQGMPWVNTVASEKSGKALFSGVQVVPHITDELAARCNTALGKAIFPSTGLSVLDGARTDCAWGRAADAVAPGLLGTASLPAHFRDDYASNSNDSAWLSNPRAPLTGYPRVVGTIGTERTARTRMTLTALEERKAGTDGLPGRDFGLRTMQDLLFANRSKIAELVVADTARMCAALPGGRAPAATGTVDAGPACRALSQWDRRFTVDSRGALLFTRFWVKLLGRGAPPWRTPFDPADPVNTPRDLDTANPAVAAAFGDAVAELARLGIAPDAPLGRHQYVVRGGKKLPTHGGPAALGLINVQGHTWRDDMGYGDVEYGASLIQVVSFTDGDCPKVARVLASSQSGDPTSPHYADQTELYAKGQLTQGRFCESEIAASPELRTVELRTP
ncbi:penicillin acylase family protein [Streptomyces sp. NPDC050263]|uniref:penicillin acylase family protein n=1 Tax=Streptomyces sp. NPDC050263 TaxID=3155037 RepID=UPI00341C229A